MLFRGGPLARADDTACTWGPWRGTEIVFGLRLEGRVTRVRWEDSDSMQVPTQILLMVVSLHVLSGCRNESDSQQSTQKNAPLDNEAEASETRTIIGSWEAVDFEYDGRPYPQLSGEVWTFDGTHLHEYYGDDISHSPHQRREYELDVSVKPKQLSLESYGGCIIVMNSMAYDRSGDLLKLRDSRRLITLQRISHTPRVTKDSWHRSLEFVNQAVVESREPMRQALDGYWRLVAILYEGDLKSPSGTRYRIGSGRMEQLQELEEHQPTPRIHIRIDPTSHPKRIDLIIDSQSECCGSVNYFAGIYEVQRSTLRVLLATRGKRPSGFDSPTPFRLDWTFERDDVN